MSTIQISATDGAGDFDALVVTPKGGTPCGAVVVIQEIFGINDAMRATCDWVADLGYIAICPDLFWRQERHVDITDKTEAEWQKAFALMNGLDQKAALADLKATLARARTLPGCNGRAASMGFCLGGRLAFMMATDSDADANISYYGVGLDGLVDGVGRVRKPLLLHIAELDKFVPPEARAKVLAAVAGKAGISAHVYPGVDHAFARVDGTSWNGRAATIANGRTAELLAATLG